MKALMYLLYFILANRNILQRKPRIVEGLVREGQNLSQNIFSRIVKTANELSANGEGYMYKILSANGEGYMYTFSGNN